MGLLLDRAEHSVTTFWREFREPIPNWPYIKFLSILYIRVSGKISYMVCEDKLLSQAMYQKTCISGWKILAPTLVIRICSKSVPASKHVLWQHRMVEKKSRIIGRNNAKHDSRSRRVDVEGVYVKKIWRLDCLSTKTCVLEYSCAVQVTSGR